ncbi:MAG: serine hydrolase [Candidatus Marinimicrobia bacterium]|jgi:beta-lactamase class A|nr:serine hydrolase [Candidatus Neomarinimicrobiota bacterium]MBT4361770.1 serine hydrolase [Candidatus Neomarinimicrobiota bacterium]MBT4714474.1 serine hydrolase [Candidatus Neomarinimicrobiota bacterium]MBT4946175.1 serine hydrolase [Candidatus Neomarinimicrobiota bacterium]MBT5268974.1 serine hydrolase [Candidatus Neomarinimicrobiota bacterium]
MRLYRYGHAIIVLSLLLIVSACSSTKISPAEESKAIDQNLQTLITHFKGDVGIYAKNLSNGQEIALNADSLFPTASMVKIPILLVLFDRIQSGDLAYDSTLMWMPEVVNYPPGGMLSSLKDSSKISLTKMISLMITYSDNHASLWCQELAGGGLQINQWLQKNGFSKTRMNSRTLDRQDDWKIYGWGQTTPREMAGLLTMIHENKAVSPWASEEMYRYLTRIYWDDEALSAIPRTVQVASKQGAVSQSRSEVVLVNAPGGAYVFCVITNNQVDESWDADNTGYVLLREVSALLWSAWGI